MAFSIRIFPPKRRIKLYGLICLTLIAIKIPWALMMCEDGKDLLSETAKEALLARRQYLIDKTELQGAPTENMPSYLSGQFQGEWAIVTYSMFSSALTKITFKFPY